MRKTSLILTYIAWVLSAAAIILFFICGKRVYEMGSAFDGITNTISSLPDVLTFKNLVTSICFYILAANCLLVLIIEIISLVKGKSKKYATLHFVLFFLLALLILCQFVIFSAPDTYSIAGGEKTNGFFKMFADCIAGLKNKSFENYPADGILSLIPIGCVALSFVLILICEILDILWIKKGCPDFGEVVEDSEESVVAEEDALPVVEEPIDNLLEEFPEEPVEDTTDLPVEEPEQPAPAAPAAAPAPAPSYQPSEKTVIIQYFNTFTGETVSPDLMRAIIKEEIASYFGSNPQPQQKVEVKPQPKAEPVPQPKAEPMPEPKPEPVVEETDEEETEEPAAKKKIIRIPFVKRMKMADKDLVDHYNELKSYLLAYGVNSRVSNSGDAFRLHTKTYVKITIAGKSLKLYYALDPRKYRNSTIPVDDASGKNIYTEIPLVFKVKSGLSVKRAKQLIDDAMAVDGLTLGEVKEHNWAKEL